MTQHYIGKTNQKQENENDCDLIQNPLYSSKIESNDEQIATKSSNTIITPNPVTHSLKTPSNVNKFNPFDTEMDASNTPQIQVDSETFTKPHPPNSLVISQKLSHSSNDVHYDEKSPDSVNYYVRSNSQHEITLNIAQSHSESALRQLKTMPSPVSSSTKDMVFSPLTKLAKGVQTLGANLDPRKMKVRYTNPSS